MPSLSHLPGTLLLVSCTFILTYLYESSTLDTSILQNGLIQIKYTNDSSQSGQKSFTIYPSTCEENSEIGKVFDDIFSENKWKSKASISGPGSELKNVLPTIQRLEQFIIDYNISSFADIPCGDVAWQFSSKELNTMNPYFGADISKYVIKENIKKFKEHQNKLFQTWDLTKCKIPKYKMMNDDSDSYQMFDMAMTRDVIQHLPLNEGLKFVKNVVLSDIKYWAVTSYETMENRDLPTGGYYGNNLEIEPFNLPKENILIKIRSHPREIMENDNFIVFKIDENMRKIVQNYTIN